MSTQAFTQILVIFYIGHMTPWNQFEAINNDANNKVAPSQLKLCCYFNDKLQKLFCFICDFQPVL